MVLKAINPLSDEMRSARAALGEDCKDCRCNELMGGEKIRESSGEVHPKLWNQGVCVLSFSQFSHSLGR